MDTKSTGVSIFSLAALATILGFAVYPLVPAQIASHWDLAGQVNGYLPKEWGIFLFPYIILFIFIIWWAIPYLEPMKKNLEAFRESYNGFMLVIAIFFFYVYALVIGANVGWLFDFTQALAPALALVFAAAGVLLAHSKRNYLVGIRTPWTLSSDKVWDRTHVVASYLFYFCGVWAFAGFFFPEYLAWFLLFPLMATIVIVIVYSYIEFRRQ